MGGEALCITRANSSGVRPILSMYEEGWGRGGGRVAYFNDRKYQNRKVHVDDKRAYNNVKFAFVFAAASNQKNIEASKRRASNKKAEARKHEIEKVG